MPASLDLEAYDSFWGDTVFADSDMEYEMEFETLRAAQRMRFRGYGYMRALRVWVADPMVHEEDKKRYLVLLKNMRLKELVIQEQGGKAKLIIRPRAQLQVKLVSRAANLDAVLPTVRARIEDDRDVKEAELEYQRRVAAGEIEKTVVMTPHQEQEKWQKEFLENLGVGIKPLFRTPEPEEVETDTDAAMKEKP